MPPNPPADGTWLRALPQKPDELAMCAIMKFDKLWKTSPREFIENFYRTLYAFTPMARLRDPDRKESRIHEVGEQFRLAQRQRRSNRNRHRERDVTRFFG